MAEIDELDVRSASMYSMSDYVLNLGVDCDHGVQNS